MNKIINWFFIILILFQTKSSLLKTDVILIKLSANTKNLEKFFEPKILQYLNTPDTTNDNIKIINDFIYSRILFFEILQKRNLLYFSQLSFFKDKQEFFSNKLNKICIKEIEMLRSSLKFCSEKSINNYDYEKFLQFIYNENYLSLILSDYSNSDLIKELYEEFVKIINYSFSNFLNEKKILNFVDVEIDDFKYYYFLNQIFLILILFYFVKIIFMFYRRK
jgi:hypothetical protein